MDEQPAPETRCPECGAAPAPDPEHRLAALGYLHDDVVFECSAADCDTEWTHGVPVGDYDGPLADDVACAVCESSGLVHRVEPADKSARLHFKCPECYHFWTVDRETGPGGKILVGYPQLTGSTDGAKPEGY